MLKKQIARILLILFLLATSILGLWNGLDDLTYAKSPGQIAVALSVCFYGIASLIAIAGLLLRRKWTFWVTMIWAALCAFAAGGATLHFGDASFATALIAAVSTLLISGPVVWLTWWVTKSSSV